MWIHYLLLFFLSTNSAYFVFGYFPQFLENMNFYVWVKKILKSCQCDKVLIKLMFFSRLFPHRIFLPFFLNQ